MQFPVWETAPDLPVLGSAAGSCFKKAAVRWGREKEDEICHEAHASQWDPAVTLT